MRRAAPVLVLLAAAAKARAVARGLTRRSLGESGGPGKRREDGRASMSRLGAAAV